MAKLRVKFTFPPELITQPVIYNMAIKHHVVPNIRRADITANRGWVILELEGEAKDLEAAIADVKGQGLLVELVEGDIIES